MTDKVKLPPIGPHDHPEPHTLKWSQLELSAIKEYATAAVLADRAQRVPERKPEPAGLFIASRRDLLGRVTRWDQVDSGGEPLYRTPPQPERKPMTYEEIDRAWRSADYTLPYDVEFRTAVVRAVEAFHGIKETP